MRTCVVLTFAHDAEGKNKRRLFPQCIPNSQPQRSSTLLASLIFIIILFFAEPVSDATDASANLQEDPEATPLSAPITVKPPEGTSAAIDAVVKMVEDVDGMIARLPAVRGGKGPADGELSALEEEVTITLGLVS